MGSSSRSSGRCPAARPPGLASSTSRASSYGAGWRSRDGPGRAARRAPVDSRRLQRAQEVQQMMLVAVAETLELEDHRVRLRRPELAVAAAAMGEDGLHQVSRAAVVQEEDPLAEPPEGRGPELVAPRNPLDDVVGQPRSHIVDEQVREKVDVLV